MKTIYFGLLAVTIAVCSAFATKPVSVRDTVYYQFYLDSTGYPYLFQGASEEFILTGCKFGDLICGKLYEVADVTETPASSGIYVVTAGHEENQVATYYRTPE
ncbi:hypothetical protein SAMN05518672_103226 [Chitinophaga sp. CF118]|uniref:hypothetical protein n=1 Tax=Chitinophaga sp. CF118 TaxID=1884367 RepID=UPI0008E1CCEC|nr:hypothetical protein [Chitinophaga sp. CF118]SFD78987.1 hypothetical protein SAMN05518672_103226 [Chitinophaga sp. CF118]